MPKQTFFNLSKDKQARILEACTREFERRPIHEASVSDIVNELGIARGSFYQYFDSLNECYFTVLDAQNIDIHRIFAELLPRHKGDFFKALSLYGKALAAELFGSSRHALFKNWFLYSTPQLERQWQSFLSAREGGVGALQAKAFASINAQLLASDLRSRPFEAMEYTKAVIHQLIRRAFLENWDSALFLRHYTTHVRWMRQGMEKPKPQA